jgi:histidine triad (HIT) family protein
MTGGRIKTGSLDRSESITGYNKQLEIEAGLGGLLLRAGVACVANYQDSKVEVRIMPPPTEDCPFCKMVRRELEHVPVLEDRQILAVMDLYPATAGHVLVLPKKHIETLYEMPADLGARIMAATIMLAKAIKEKLSPDGLNLIQSNQPQAGQTVSHFHLHIVPRYKGDPVILQFGHGSTPERVAELERIAAMVKSGLRLESKAIA